MEQLMQVSLGAMFFLYLLSAIAFVMAVTGKGSRVGKEVHTRRWGRRGIILALIGIISNIIFIASRLMIGGHFTSNMFEFTSFLAFAIAVAFVVIFFIYRAISMGAFAMPLVVILLAYAINFPTEVEPLIPALQSYWLHIHVTTAALGEGALSVGFVAGLVYLIRWVGEDRSTRTAAWLEVVMAVILMFVGFVAASFTFGALDYQVTYKHVVDGQLMAQEYNMPPIAGPFDGELLESQTPFGWTQPFFEVPEWMKGENAASKFNSVLWSIIAGLILYGLLRLLFRKRVYEMLYPVVRKMNLENVDEVSYRAIALGYPIFTLGALVFAMIWAHEAWGRFWGWDPKETWALITWLYYSAYLHFRLSRGWHGLKSAWMAVGGFLIIMINLIVVNFVFAGLHSYA